MKSLLQYPQRDRVPSEAFGLETLQMATAQLLSWQHGPGDFGGLHLHACWDNDSSLSRKYHGSSVSRTSSMYEGVRELAIRSRSPKWLYLKEQMIASILWHQSPEGGFFHASGEAEPTYTSRESCPIHQMRPVFALLSHYQDSEASDPIRSEIEEVLKRHLKWFESYWWKLGNGYVRPLTVAGWCGVTNQDLVAVVALAKYGEVMGDWEPFNQYGLPTLDMYLSSQYFHDNTGFFERGDNANFTERCSYMCLIVNMLDQLYRIRPDDRIPVVIDRVVDVLLKAVYVDRSGDTQMSLGLDDIATQQRGVHVWNRQKVQLGDYPEFIQMFERFGAEKSGIEDVITGLERTLAQYVYADGMIPTTLDSSRPLFSMVSGSYNFVNFWNFLLERNTVALDRDLLPSLPRVRRRCGNLEFLADRDQWLLLRDDKEVFHGVKRIPHGIVPFGEKLANDPYQFIETDCLNEIVQVD